MGRTHAHHLHELETARVTAVCDVDPETADAVAWDVGAESYYDLDDFFRETSLEALVVATPPHVRRTIVEPAAREGVVLYVEKPPAATAEEARACDRALRASSTPAVVGFMFRLHPLVHELKDRLESCEVTQVRTLFTARMDSQGDGPLRYELPEGAMDPLLVDACVHNFDLGRDLLGSTRRLTARGSRRLLPDNVAASWSDTMIVGVEWEGGTLGVHQFSAGPPVDRFELELVGDSCHANLDLVNGTLSGSFHGESVNLTSDWNVYAGAMESFVEFARDPKKNHRFQEYRPSLRTLSDVRAADRSLGSEGWEPVEPLL